MLNLSLMITTSIHNSRFCNILHGNHHFWLSTTRRVLLTWCWSQTVGKLFQRVLTLPPSRSLHLLMKIGSSSAWYLWSGIFTSGLPLESRTLRESIEIEIERTWCCRWRRWFRLKSCCCCWERWRCRTWCCCWGRWFWFICCCCC